MPCEALTPRRARRSAWNGFHKYATLRRFAHDHTDPVALQAAAKATKVAQRFGHLERCRAAARRGDVDSRGRPTLAAAIGAHPECKSEIKKLRVELRTLCDDLRGVRRHSRQWFPPTRPPRLQREQQRPKASACRRPHGREPRRRRIRSSPRRARAPSRSGDDGSSDLPPAVNRPSAFLAEHDCGPGRVGMTLPMARAGPSARASTSAAFPAPKAVGWPTLSTRNIWLVTHWKRCRFGSGLRATERPDETLKGAA